MALATENELQDAYEGGEIAARYVGERFSSEVNRLLHDRQITAINRVMETARPERVLEIAPGPGRLTRHLRPQNSLVCLEFNEGMISQGRSVCDPLVTWVRGNGFQLPFGSGFDFVYTFRFVRHFHRKDRDRLYSEIRRVLKPGGYFVMDAVNRRISKPLRDALPDEYRIHDELYQSNDLREELLDVGFNTLSLTPVQKCFGLQFRSQVLLGPRGNWLNRLVIRGLERLPFRDGLEWIVTCQKE